MKVVLVSGNPGKLRELRALLPTWQLESFDTTGIGDETGATFHDNAQAKARWGRSRAPADVWVLGEDSGLEVSGLGGQPGIRSARYARAGASDEENRTKLLEELGPVDDAGQRARYVCEMVLIGPEAEEISSRGTLDGTIAREARGTAGFGYDPIFVPVGETATVAFLGDSWKRAHSHRARAVRALVEALSGRSSPP